MLHALARNRNQPEVVKLENFVRRLIGAHGFFKRLHHLLTILALIHVDEIDYDDAAQVAQADLPHNLLHGFRVGLHNSVFEPVGFADVLARVDVNRYQSFGLVNHDVAAGLEPHLGAQRLFQLLCDVEGVKDGR